ncbi:MAG: hypothetical protein AAF556_11865, partial [Pseudomonadota bacterium]
MDDLSGAVYWLLTEHKPLYFAAITAGVLVLAAVLGWLATSAVLIRLRRQAILDHPNERSSHQAPTPR